MVNCVFKRTVCAIACWVCASSLSAKSIQVCAVYAGSWQTKEAAVVDEVSDFERVPNGRDTWNRYGSYKYLRADSTGYFHVQKIDGRWWLIDPDGYAGINRAVTSFSDPTTVQYDYDLCSRIGFNAAGNFVASESQTKDDYNVTNYATWGYTRRYAFHSSYKSYRKKKHTTPTGDYVFVLDPEFEEFCNSAAESNIRPFASERDLIGWFTDNEIPFNEDQLGYLITELDSLDPSRAAARVWAAERGITESDIRTNNAKVTNTIKKQFAGYLAERYYSVVEQAIRSVDPVHMILGSRLHGRPRANTYVVQASHAHTDVTSVNFYDYYSPNDQIAKSSWTQDHPCLVSEFYIKDINYQPSSQSGAGWYVQSQTDRGYWYENTCLQLLASKCYIGWQYFRYMDDSGGSNKGIVSLDKNEYTDMTRWMQDLNEQVYALCDYYDGLCRDTLCTSPHMDIVTINASCDDADGETMDVRFAQSQANSKSAMLQFALPSQRGPIRHAVLRLNVASADNQTHHLLISSVNGMADGDNDMNRVAYDINPISTGRKEYDITTYLSEHTSDSLTLRIHALIATEESIRFYSSRAEQDLQPQLVVTYIDSISNEEPSAPVDTIFADNFSTLRDSYALTSPGNKITAENNMLVMRNVSGSSARNIAVGDYGHDTALNEMPVDSLVWTFHMRQNYTSSQYPNLSGFDNAKRGVATMLLASESDLTTANGYAIVMGGNSAIQYRLVKVTGGLLGNSNLTDIIGGQVHTQYLHARDNYAFRIVYIPATKTWKMQEAYLEYNSTTATYLAPDDVEAWIEDGTEVDDTHGAIPLKYFGFYHNYTGSTTFNAYFSHFTLCAYRTIGDKETPTALDNTPNSSCTVKMIQNGQLIILRNGVKYTVTGAVL